MSMAELLKISTASDFLLEDSVPDAFKKIFEERGLPVERRGELLDLTSAIIDGVLLPKDAPEIIAGAFGLDEAKAKELTCDALGYGVLPLENFVPGIAEAITALGGDVKKYPSFRVGKEKITAVALSAYVQKQAGIQFSDVLTKRLALLLEGRVKGEKNADALRQYFGRGLAIGGLGLAKEKVDALLAAIEAEVPNIELVSEEDAKKVVEVVKVGEVEKVAEVAPVANELEVAPSHEVAAEVPMRMSIPKKDEVPVEEYAAKKARALQSGKAEANTKLKAAVEASAEAAKPVLLSKNIPLEKFRDLAEKNIRGVRDAGQTRNILEKDWTLSGADLRVVLDALALGTAQYTKVDAAAAPVLPPVKVSDDGIKEANAMDEKFAVLTKTSPTESVMPVLPGARVSAAREAALPTLPGKGGSAAGSVVRPKLARAELTVGSVPPTAPERKFTDVVQASRLMGPIEQLKSMTSVAFRRLSGDPAEATQKIDDLLSSLATNGYEDKVQGIKAWRQSPMNQLYLSITEEALSAGLSVPEVASERRKAGKDSLSPAEIKALVGLNMKLRF